MSEIRFDTYEVNDDILAAHPVTGLGQFVEGAPDLGCGGRRLAPLQESLSALASSCSPGPFRSVTVVPLQL